MIQYFSGLYSIQCRYKIMSIIPCAVQYIFVLWLLCLFIYLLACGILVSWPEIQPRPLAVKALGPNLRIAREFLSFYFIHSSLYLSVHTPYPHTLDVLPSFLVITSLSSVSVFLFCMYIHLYFLDFLYGWYHTVFVFLWHSTKHNVLLVHPHLWKWQD